MKSQEPTPVLDHFSDQVRARPSAVAVTHGDHRMSYAELDQRANQLARHLQAHGARRGSVVMIHLDRSVDLIVSLLATWKAGATYLPVDPGQPDHRVATFVKETGCALVITSAVDRFTDLPVQALTADAVRSSAYSAEAVPVVAGGVDCAYIVYTSGSSGSPKGVKVCHASLGYLVDEVNKRYRIAPDDRVLQFAATSFDTSIEQILVTLLNGATLVLPDYAWAPSELSRCLIEHAVTVMDLTPTFWRAFLAELSRSPVELPVRLTIVGGSAMHVQDCRTALRLMPRSRLVNAYGLTETTITSCTMEITSDTLPQHGPAPVGRPLDGTDVHVLDDDLRPVGPGRSGEIYLGGPGVATGYVTEQVSRRTGFVPGLVLDNGSVPVREPMYRTGDFGTWTPDGDLVVLGRVDRQLKVRGFRVEPAEIEIVLATHESIDDVVVKAYDHNGEPRIAAYYTVTGHQTPRPPSAELRVFLADHLPDFMIPSVFVQIDEMPVTVNGKADLDVLPDPSRTPHRSASSPEAGGTGPASDLVARAVAALWCQVLDVSKVVPDDNFFDRGGNSILAAELLAKVRATLGVVITQVRPLIRLLLEDATLRSFAAAVESARAGTLTGASPTREDFEADATVRVPIQRSPSSRPSWQDPQHVFLTGATGFLGVYLLRELLQTTNATIHCLVRAAGPHQAMERIQANARHYFRDDLGQYLASGRIRALPGDLAETGLGLSTDEFDRLARTVDVIHHPGGLVNFIYPYSHMRPANVDGTREIIRMAGRHRRIPIHYISTMAVISGFGTAGVDHVTEHTPAAHVDRLSVGYVESKWVAEALLQNAVKEGLPVAIYRAADISGDCESGAWNTATEMCAMKKFIVDTGAAPIAELPMDYTPVDRYAAAVTHIASQKLPAGEVYHLTNPQKANVALLTERLRAHGHTIDEVPWNTWLEQIVEMAVEQPGHPMTPFAPLFIDRCSTGEMSVAEMYLEDTFPSFSRDNVDAALDGSGIEIPPVDARMIDRYIRYLTSIDFL